MSTTSLFSKRPWERVRRVAVRAAAIGGAGLASEGVHVLLVAWPIGALDAAALLAEIARQSLMLGTLLALVLESLEDRAANSEAWVARASLVAGAAVAVLLSSALDHSPAAFRLGLISSPRSLRLHSMWNDTVVALVAITYLMRRKDSVRAEQRRLALEARLREARQQLAVIAAQTARSRIDPQMLFDCMRRARDEYAGELAGGDSLLERLTNYLRLTLGGATGGACTLGREAAIAVARSDVERSGDDPPLELDIPAELNELPFPPHLLSVLSRDWLSAPITPPGAMRIWARLGTLSLHVTVVGPCPTPFTAVQACQRMIAEYTSGNGKVAQDANAVHMELPYAHA
jgi:hypothetical protein